MNIIRSGIVLSIKFYQKFISPKKGFLCAHNVLHQNGSCSGIIMKTIKFSPIKKWRKEINGQLESCRMAKYELIKKQKKDSNKTSCCNNVQTCDVSDCAVDSCHLF